MSVCHICGVPWDAGFFDESRIFEEPNPTKEVLPPGQEIVLARYELSRQYCGVLMGFAQFTDLYATDRREVRTPGYQWQIRCNGRPRDPYLTFEHIINPWDAIPFPAHLRLEEGCVIEFAVRRADEGKKMNAVGGRIIGRYWYNTIYGGAPNPL